MPKFRNSSFQASCPAGESESPTATVCGRLELIAVVAADGLEPLHVLERRVVLRLELLELGRVSGREREQLQHVEAEEPLGVQQPELARDHRAAVAAVRAVALVAESAHEFVIRTRDSRHRPAALDDRRAEREAGHRGHDDRERVLGTTAVGDRVDERIDHVEEVDERARVGVQQEQRGGALLLRRCVDEVDGLAVDLGEVVRELVHPRLLGAPVEVTLPLLDRGGEPGVGNAEVPVVARSRLRQTRASESLAQVVDLGLGDVDTERTDAGRAGRVLLHVFHAIWAIGRVRS